MAGQADPDPTPGGRGCHLNRPIDRLVGDAGFVVTQMENYYMKGPKPMGYKFEGLASKA